MATEKNKRFVFRTPEKKKTEYFISTSGPRALQSPNISPSIEVTAEKASAETPAELPARRVVIIRNAKHSQINQEQMNLEDFDQSNSQKVSPVISNGVSFCGIE